MLTGQTVHRHGAGAARAAHNREVTGSKPVAGIYYLSALKKPMVIARGTINMSTPFHRRGAAAARAAHNRKDIRSKRIAGIFQFAVSRTASLSLQHPYHRSGAEVSARGS
jgi:hypothetical protein